MIINSQETPKSDEGILHNRVGRFKLDKLTNLIDLLAVVVTHLKVNTRF